MLTCISVALSVLHKKTIVIALLSHLSPFCVFQLSARTTTCCIWLPLPYGLSLRGVQPFDPLLYPCYIFLCQLPTVNYECSSGVEAVGFQTLSWGFMQVDKGAVIEAKRFLLLFSSGSTVSTIYLNSLIQSAMPHPISNLFWRSLCQIWYDLHGKDERVLLNPGMKRLCFFRNSEFCSLILTTI